MPESEFETRPIYRDEVEISVEMFAETFGDRDMVKLLHKNSREKMIISADLLMKMLKTPTKAAEPKLPWLAFTIPGAIVLGAVFTPFLSEQTRLLILAGLAAGTLLGAFLGYFWKPIAHRAYEKMKAAAEEGLKKTQ